MQSAPASVEHHAGRRDRERSTAALDAFTGLPWIPSGITGVRRRVALTILGTLGLVLAGGMFIAMATAGNHPPGSP